LHCQGYGRATLSALIAEPLVLSSKEQPQTCNSRFGHEQIVPTRCRAALAEAQDAARGAAANAAAAETEALLRDNGLLREALAAMRGRLGDATVTSAHRAVPHMFRLWFTALPMLSAPQQRPAVRIAALRRQFEEHAQKTWAAGPA
jgi:hypothetical protein